MKTLIPFVALIFAAFSLQAQSKMTPLATAVSPDAQANIAVYEQLMLGLLNGNYDQAYAVLAEDFYMLGEGPDTLRRDGLIELWKGYASQNESQSGQGWATSLDLSSPDLNGTWVMAWLHGQWTMKGTDQPIHSWVHQAAQVEDGKIKVIYQFQDNLAVLMQMGFQVVPPATENR
jgi:hypothetical protein